MGFYPFEVTPAHLVYTLLGGFTVIFGMFSALIKEKLYLGEAPIATIFGIILGPHVSGLIDPYKWAHGEDEVRDEITLEITRVVIAVSVFAVGVELPKAYMLRHWRSMSILLLPAMLYGWFISALFMWALIPGLKFLSCLVIAAAVTPTDPILAQSVIGGKFADKHVPAHIRNMLSAESGSNDGAAFPFLYIALYLTLDASPGHAVAEWFYATIAYEIVLGTLLGSLLGYVARKVMQYTERKGYIDRQSFVAQYVSLALLSMGGTVLLGSDDLLSAFACGCAFAWDGYFNQQTEDAVFSNVVDLLFNCAAFIYIGALLPFPSFNHHEIGLDWWRLFLLAICILVARRLPAIIAMYKFIPDIKTFREACFTGWFGPMGVGAVFISTLARHSLPEGDADADTEQVDRLREVISPITLFLVLSSILTHGLSIPFFSLGRRVHSLTYTWSRNPSIRDQPAWTTHTQRVRPGESIIVNRDEEDGEAGDLGVRRVSPDRESSYGKDLTLASGSDGSGSGRRGQEYEMTGRRGREEGDEAEDDQDRAGVRAERAARDTGDEDGGRTPPMAEYREGDHLVIERKNTDTGEIDVEVIRHYFRDDREPRRHAFTHPHSLEDDRGLLASIMPTLERWASNASGTLSRVGSRASTRPGTPLPTHREGEDDETGSAVEKGASGPPAASPPLIQVHPPSSGGEESSSVKQKPTLRSRLFGRRSSGGQGSGGGGSGAGSKPEMQERSSGGIGIALRPMVSASSLRSGQGQGQGQGQAPLSPGSTNSNLDLTRTQSLNRTIRFAPELAPSSDTAPGPQGSGSGSGSPGATTNYGNGQTGFKRTPGLAMFRSTSIKEDE